MSSKVSSLNLFDVETKSSKLDIDVSSSKVDITTTGGQYVKITPPLHLVDSVSGDITDVAVKINANAQAIIDGNAGSAVASALVQSNLDAYSSSTNTTLGQLQSDLSNEIGQRTAGQTSDALARTSLQTSLETKISDEETARASDITTLTSTIATETQNRTTAITAVNSTIASLQTSVDSAISVERSRIDSIIAGSSVDLDQLQELVTSYESADSSLLTTVNAIQAQLTALQSVVDSLTSS